MNARALLIILAIIVLAAVGYLAYSRSEEANAPTATTTDMTAEVPVVPETDGSNVTVTYDGDSFSPASVSVPVGATVIWTNETTGRMWVAADEHPTHTQYDGTAREEHCADGAPTSATVFDQCGAGERYSFTFTKPGTWEYHNHANPGARGSVTVTQ